MSRGTNIKSSANFRFKQLESVFKFKFDFKLKFVDLSFDFEVAGIMLAGAFIISGPSPGGGGWGASNLLLRRPGLVTVVVRVSVTVSEAVVDEMLDGQSVLESFCSVGARVRAVALKLQSPEDCAGGSDRDEGIDWVSTSSCVCGSNCVCVLVIES